MIVCLHESEASVPIEISCPYCDQRLSAPDSADGRQARCPACGETVLIQASIYDAETFDDDEPESRGRNPEPPILRQAPEPVHGGDQRFCPMCGEQVAASVRQCPYCHEALRPGGRRHRRKKEPMTGAALGISALIFVCIPWYSIPVGIAGIVVSLKEKERSQDRGEPSAGSSTTGLVCSIIALAVALIGIVVFVGLMEINPLEFFE